MHTQTLQQQHHVPGSSPKPALVLAPAGRSPQRSPRWSNPPPDPESRPAWGSPLGTTSPRVEQYVAARRRGGTSPRRRPRSPSGGRSSTPTGKPPTPGKKRRDRQIGNRSQSISPSTSTPPADAEIPSAWDTTEFSCELNVQAPSTSRSEPQHQRKLLAASMEPETGAKQLETTHTAPGQTATPVEPRKEPASTKAKLSRSKRAGSPGKRGRSPRRSSKTMPPEEQTRANSTQATSPGSRSTSPGRTSPGRTGGVILSRGSREEKEKLLAQVASLQQDVATAEQRKLCTIGHTCTCFAVRAFSTIHECCVFRYRSRNSN